MTSRALEVVLGLLLLVFYLLHASVWWVRGSPAEALWMCHLATVLVGLGLLVRSATLNAVGFLWQALGTPFWVLDLSVGGEFIPSSLGTHLGGLLGSAHGLWRLGMPRGAWWKALLGLAGLHVLSRLTTPPAANVNLSSAVWPGWERWFPTHGVYIAILAGLSAATFAALGAVLERALGASRT